jgi:hypothetical protein
MEDDIDVGELIQYSGSDRFTHNIKPITDFFLKFDEYLKLIPNEELDKIKKEHPNKNDWRIILIEKSGISMPREIRVEIIKYRKRQKIEPIIEETINEFMDEHENDGSINCRQLFTKFMTTYWDACGEYSNVIPYYEVYSKFRAV